jgi:hypothetical protein
VPAGVALTPYTGPCTITKAGTVIEAKKIGCSLLIKASGVVIRKSTIDGIVDSDSGSPKASVLIEDSVLDGGRAERAVVSSHHATVRRSELKGAKDSMQCNESCTVEDSWLHGQYLAPDSAAHLNGFISNGGRNMVVRGNTIACDAQMNSRDGGCTSPVAIFGDFEPTVNFVIDGNFLVASTSQSYCAYGGYDEGKPYASKVAGIVFTNNVFDRGTNGKCGAFGPVTSFLSSAPGNVWSNNTWEDGGTIKPAL